MRKRHGGMAGLMLVPVLGLAALTGGGDAASAASAYCRQLQADYRAASRSGGGNHATIRRQLNAEMARMNRQNCRGLGIFRKRGANCATISRNVQQLQRQLRSAGSGGSARRQASLQRLLERNGCTVPTREATSGSGVYRTLCVRTCDGYYFPIGNSTSRSRLKIDEAVCSAMYGDAPSRLYYQHGSRQVEDARAADGGRYEDLDTAFAYREEFDAACHAELKDGLAAHEAEGLRLAYEKYAGAEGGPVRVVRPLPRRRPAGRDPETAANCAGGFIVARVDPDVAEAEIGAPPTRQYGTNYFVAVDPIPNLKSLPPPGVTFDLIGTASAAEDRRTSLE